MFKGIQNILHKEAVGSFRDPDVLEVKTAKALLGKKKRQEILDKLPKLLNLDASKYQVMCATLLNRFADFVQLLPETQNNYYSDKGGILDHALERSSTALALVRAYFLPEKADSEPLTKKQILWAYAVFSACVLHGIGKTVSDLSIELTDRHGKRLRHWAPFEGSIASQGSYYRYNFEANPSELFRKRSTLILASKLMPIEGFHWIASTRDVLDVWLAMLDEDQRGSGTLGPVLLRADAEAIMNFYRQQKFQIKAARAAMLERARFSESTSFLHQTADGTDKKAEANARAGFEFLRWLKQQITSRKISVNKSDSSVHRTKDGALITDKAIEEFTKAKENTKYKSVDSVRQSLMKMGVHTPGEDKSSIHTLVNIDTKSTISGLLVKNYTMIMPGTVTHSAFVTQMVSKVAIGAIYDAMSKGPAPAVPPSAQPTAEPAKADIDTSSMKPPTSPTGH